MPLMVNDSISDRSIAVTTIGRGLIRRGHGVAALARIPGGEGGGQALIAGIDVVAELDRALGIDEGSPVQQVDRQAVRQRLPLGLAGGDDTLDVLLGPARSA